MSLALFNFKSYRSCFLSPFAEFPKFTVARYSPDRPDTDRRKSINQENAKTDTHGASIVRGTVCSSKQHYSSTPISLLPPNMAKGRKGRNGKRNKIRKRPKKEKENCRKRNKSLGEQRKREGKEICSNYDIVDNTRGIPRGRLMRSKMTLGIRWVENRAGHA